MGMDERKYRILQAIIDDYILTAEPVGSRTISRKYDMGLSSATIRNEMSDLEELGYLDQPHVSAGRIPSAKAYRLYVDQLLKTGKIRSADDESVKAHFAGRMHQMEDVIDHAAQVISSMTNYLAVVLPPSGKQPLGIVVRRRSQTTSSPHPLTTCRRVSGICQALRQVRLSSRRNIRRPHHRE